MTINLKLSPANARVSILSSAKLRSSRFVITARSNMQLDTAAKAQAVATSTNSRFRLIESSVVQLGKYDFRGIVEANAQIKPFADSASMQLIGESYADTAGSLWSVVDTDNARHLIRQEEDDLEAILTAIREPRSLVSVDTASTLITANHGQFVSGIDTNGALFQGVVVANHVFDVANNSHLPLEALDLFLAKTLNVRLPEVSGADIAKASKEQLADIFDYLVQVLPADFMKEVRKAAKN